MTRTALITGASRGMGESHTRCFVREGAKVLLTDMRVAEGEALAKDLAGNSVALLRGHGNVVVGHSIQQVVFRAIYTENNAKLQSEAMRQGEVNFLTDGEAEATSRMTDEHLDRPWQIWKKRTQMNVF